MVCEDRACLNLLLVNIRNGAAAATGAESGACSAFFSLITRTYERNERELSYSSDSIGGR